MLQEEFEKRIGRKVTEQEYVDADAMYMAAGNIDKDTFCREWLKVGNSRLLKCLAEKTYQQNKALQEKELLLKESREIFRDAADAMLEIEHGLLDGKEHTLRESIAAEQLEQKVLVLIGAKEVILRKIRIGIALNEKDKNYINEYLK